MAKKGGSDTSTYYGTMMFRIGLGEIEYVHCIKVDSITVWKDTEGVRIYGEYIDLDTDAGNCRIYKGSQTQTPDTNRHFTDGPAYRGKAYMRWTNLKLGTERTSVPSVECECTWSENAAGLVSPVNVIEELFTDPYLGLGALTDLFECSDEIRNQTILLAPKIDDESTLLDICDELLPLVWCYARFNGRKLSINRLYEPPEDWNSSDIPHLTSSNCVELLAITPETPTERVIQTNVKWTELYNGDQGDDTEGEYDNVAIYKDSSIPELGGKTTTIQADAIITEAVAKNYAISKGHQLALSMATGTAKVKKGIFSYEQLSYQKPIKVFDEISKTWVRARVTARTIPYSEAYVEVEWETDYTGSIHDSASIGYQEPVFTSLAPVSPRSVQLVELPRPLADKAAIGILCARGSSVVNGYGIMLSVDNGANFELVDHSTSFAVYGTLKNAISSSSSSMTLDDVTIDSSMIESASSAQASLDTILGFIGTPPNHEIVSISSINEPTAEVLNISMLRGRLGSVKQSHAIGSAVFMIRKSNLPIISSPYIDSPAPYNPTIHSNDYGNQYIFQLPQRVVAKVQDEDDCDDILRTLKGNYLSPLPPESAISESGSVYMGSDMAFRISIQLWRDEGYPAADFYESDEISILPLIQVGELKSILERRSIDDGKVTITSSEIDTAINETTENAFELQFYSYVNGRYSGVPASLQISITS